MRDRTDCVLRASNETEKARIVSRPDLHGPFEPVERRDRVVDRRLQIARLAAGGR